MCQKCNQPFAIIGMKYIPKGTLINSSSFIKIDDEFVQCREYDIYFKLTAKKDHIFNKCQCGYSWRELC